MNLNLRRPSSAQSSWLPTLIAGLCFALLVCLVNRDLFFLPQIEWGDVAANALQVQNAKRLHELLGNYSRWHFHHPGPFFFYLFAFGEYVFFDLTRLVPAPLNGEILAEVLFSTLCLFLSLHIFSRRTRRRWFLPLGVLASVLFLYALESAIPSSAVVSLWPPYMSIFSFLLLLVSAASVASGSLDDLPLMTFAGMVMLHAHVAQMLFVVALCSGALGIAITCWARVQTPRPQISFRHPALISSILIVFVFATPLVLETFVHQPSNIQNILTYLGQHSNERNSLRVAILYLLSFCVFNSNVDKILENPNASILDVLVLQDSIRLYWSSFLWISLFAIGVSLGRFRKQNSFFWAVSLELIFVSLLFLYWSCRITGPMYMFNGFFFYSVHLVALWLLCSLLASTRDQQENSRESAAVTYASCSFVMAIPGLTIGAAQHPDIQRIVSGLSAIHTNLFEIRMETPNWPVAAGVASLLTRSARPFCVEPEWEFVFGHACALGRDSTQVVFSEPGLACNPPCREIYRDQFLEVSASPDPAYLNLPVVIHADDATHRMQNFNEIGSHQAWTKNRSLLDFYCVSSPGAAKQILVAISGTSLPGRPLQIMLNHHLLGTIDDAGQSIHSFSLSASALRQGLNQMEFLTSNAGPVGLDQRELGYLFDWTIIYAEDAAPAPNTGAILRELPNPSDIKGLRFPLSWRTLGGWKLNGVYPATPALPFYDLVWGSWINTDASTGHIRSQTFISDGCLVLPVVHGPSTAGQRVSLLTADDHIVTNIPIETTDERWHMFKIQYSPNTRIAIDAEDRGEAYGQWVAIGSPLPCTSTK